MLRSPLANPMTTPMINPIRTGISEITRAILNFNGTQYATLSEPVVLDGDFEVELLVAPVGEDFMQLLSGEGDTFNVRADNQLVLILGGSTVSTFPVAVDRNKINRVILKRTSLVYEAFVNGSSASHTAVELNGFSIETILGHTSYGTPSPFQGCPFLIRIWKNGDRNTGELVTDLRFDEPDTIYQRNYAVESGSSVVGSGWVIPDGYIGILSQSQSGFIQDNSEGGGDGTRAAQVFSGLSVGTTYKVATTNAGSSTYNVYIREGSNAGNGPVVYSSVTQAPGETLEFDFEATSTDMNILYSNTGSVELSATCLVETFSGCILQNTLPGDWETVQKKRWWDYWTWVQNLFGPSLLASSWDDNGDGSYTKNTDSWGQLGENPGNVTSPGTYQIQLNYLGSNLRLYTQNPAGGNQFIPIPDQYNVLWDYDVPEAGLWIDSNVAAGDTVSDVVFRRKLQYAEGAL